MSSMDTLVNQTKALTNKASDLLRTVDDNKNRIISDRNASISNVMQVEIKLSDATANSTAATSLADSTNAEKSKAKPIAVSQASSLTPKANTLPRMSNSRQIDKGWLPEHPRVPIPVPDLWLPLNDSLVMETGQGKRDQLTVDGKQYDLNTCSATFSRATSATYINKSGQLVTAKENEPRFEKEGILVEGSSTNLWSSTIKAPPPVNNAKPSEKTIQGFFGETITTVVGGSPSMGVACDKLTGINTLSVFANFKKNSKPFVINFYDGTTRNTTIDTTNLTANSGHEDIKWGKVTHVSGDWYRISVTANFELPTKPVHVHVYSLDGSVFLSYWQIEALPFASSYIPTDGKPATRAADILEIPKEIADNTVTSLGDLTCSIQYHLDMDISEEIDIKHRCVLFHQPGFYYNLCRIQKTGITYYTQAVNSWYPYSKDDNKKTGTVTTVTRDDTNNIYFNGKPGKINTQRHSPRMGEFQLGRWGGATYVFGHIRNFRLWNRALTDEQIASL